MQPVAHPPSPTVVVYSRDADCAATSCRIPLTATVFAMAGRGLIVFGAGGHQASPQRDVALRLARLHCIGRGNPAIAVWAQQKVRGLPRVQLTRGV